MDLQITMPLNYSVKPKNFEALSLEERTYFEKLDSFRAPYLEEKLLLEGEVKDNEEYQMLFNEFKKYVALIAISRQSLGMVSKKVDTVWHQFILFTRSYADFCNKFYGGKFIHHEPKTSFTPLKEGSEEKFYQWYGKVYGELPQVWRHNHDNRKN